MRPLVSRHRGVDDEGEVKRLDAWLATKNEDEPRLTASTSRNMAEQDLLARITINPKIFGGKPIIRGRRLAVEHVLGMLAAGDTAETLLEGYPWLEPEDIRACLLYAQRHVGHERIELMTTELDHEIATS
jgi:uncharacterized protein (DUF433 family)